MTNRYNRESNFIAPAPREPIRAYPVVAEPEYSQLAPIAPAQAEVMLRTTYKDRADGFLRATTPLAAVTGVIALIGAVALLGVPFLSFFAALWFFGGFALVWLIAYLAHLIFSPDGSTWWNTWQLWGVVKREQKFRHERFWTQYYDQRDGDE